MNPELPNPELLLRLLEGHATREERAEAVNRLQRDPAARAFLREVAEQAVMVADLERTDRIRRDTLTRTAVDASADPRLVTIGFRSWRNSMIAAAAIIALLFIVVRSLAPSSPPLLRVTKVVGAGQVLGANGRQSEALTPGDTVRIGDTVETHSMDSWIEMEAVDGAMLTIAGRASVRILDRQGQARRLQLQEGNLWINPPSAGAYTPLQVATPIASLETTNAQLDVHSSSSETLVRVNEGSVTIRQLLDGSIQDVPRGYQLLASLSRPGPLTVSPQPAPVDYWACNLGGVPRLTVGQWLPATPEEAARLGAAPLLWPVRDGDSILLYASALSVLSTSDHPVRLRPGAKLVFRGRTALPQTVRFGFKTQRMRGIFAGKFELDVPPADLGPADRTWNVELPVTRFRALQPQLSDSPEGLELTDVYALTIGVDAGLEINHIELVPPE